MSQFTYFQSQLGNTIPQQLLTIPVIHFPDHAYPPPTTPYSGNLSNFSTIPSQYPATSYSQSNIPTQYPSSKNIISQQMSIVPNVLNGPVNSFQQYQYINPIPLNQENNFQPYSRTAYNLGTPNPIMIPMEQNKLLEGNLSNQIQMVNPLTNQQNFVQYNIFPQAINSFNSGNQSYAPYGMNLGNNVNNFNGQIIQRENIMNQYGQNKNNINTNSGLQNLIINNDRNTNEKDCRENKDIDIPSSTGVGLKDVPMVVPVKEKKVEFECPMCHEEYDRDDFWDTRRSTSYSDLYQCSSCNKYIESGKYFFKCYKCDSIFCDYCTGKSIH